MLWSCFSLPDSVFWPSSQTTSYFSFAAVSFEVHILCLCICPLLLQYTLQLSVPWSSKFFLSTSSMIASLNSPNQSASFLVGLPRMSDAVLYAAQYCQHPLCWQQKYRGKDEPWPLLTQQQLQGSGGLESEFPSPSWVVFPN